MWVRVKVMEIILKIPERYYLYKLADVSGD